MVNRFRDFLSILAMKIQTVWMERYGYFDKNENYVRTKDVPYWAYEGFRQLGFLAFNLDPNPNKFIE